MFGIILSVVILVALFGSLMLINWRREQAERRRPKSAPRPDPQLVDRPFNPALCAFCDEPGDKACHACGRKMCADHRPLLREDRFCWPCEAAWERGARKRAFVVTPLVFCGIFASFLALAGAAFLVGAIGGFMSGKLMLGAFITPLVLGAPLYLKIERVMRRRFRRDGGVPKATART